MVGKERRQRVGRESPPGPNAEVEDAVEDVTLGVLDALDGSCQAVKV